MKYHNGYTGSLYEKTRKLLQASKLKPQDIYAETGLPFYWIKKFNAGEFENPSVNRVQFLYEYLSNTTLVV